MKSVVRSTAGPLAATCLDLPAGSPGGSVELFLDLYTGDEPLIPARPYIDRHHLGAVRHRQRRGMLRESLGRQM